MVVSSNLGFELTSAGLTFTFGKNDFGGVQVNGQAGKINEWNLALAAAGDVAEDLTGNVVLSTVITEPEVVACLAGGYTTLQVNEATSDCAGEFPIAAGVTAGQRQQIASGYNALRAMLDAMQGIIRSGVEIAL